MKSSLKVAGSDKVDVLFALCKQAESMPPDSGMAYAQQARQISIAQHNNANRLHAEFFIARAYIMLGKADSCLQLCNRSMGEITDMQSSFTLFHQFMWYKIVSLTKLRKIKDAIAECFDLLQSAEKYNDFSAEINAYNNLGVNNNILGNHQEALGWFNKAYALISANNVYNNFPLVFTNLAALYFNSHNQDSGYYFLKKAFVIARANENLRNESDCFTEQGLVYVEQGKMDSAEQMLKQAAALQKQIGNIQYILVGIDALQAFYAKQKNYPKAIEYIKEAEEYSRIYNQPITVSFYADLAECYKQMKDYTAYGETMDTLMKLKDSMYFKNKTDELAKLEAQYDVSSREAFIAKQKLELLHKNTWIAAIVVAALLIAVTAYFLFYRYNIKQANALLAAREKERKRIAADLHDNLGAFAAAIQYNVEEISDGDIADKKIALQQLQNNSQEIISQLHDTIWALNKETISLTATGDRFKAFLQKLRASYPAIKINVEENIEGDYNLSPLQALHLFRMMQEIVNNALRHSHCHQINIDFIYKGIFRVIITDDGTGMGGAMANTGNGIKNIMLRAKQAGFFVQWLSDMANGTKVVISVAGEGGA